MYSEPSNTGGDSPDHLSELKILALLKPAANFSLSDHFRKTHPSHCFSLDT